MIDQATKFWARSVFVETQRPGWPIPGKFEFTLQYNKGIAFGMMQGAGVLMTPVAILIAGAAAVYSYRNPNETRWSHAAMGLLAAGALGNLWDRLVFGRVTDMIYFSAINFPVFNIADACITAAAIMLALAWSREVSHARGDEAPTPKPTSAEAES